MSDRMRILLIDDEEIVSRRLRPALEREGYEVESFRVGKDALTSIANKDFDIVITDMRIDEVNGLQVLEAALKKSSKTKVVLITGYATTELAREALAKGAFEVLAKPFKPQDLRDAISRAIAAADPAETHV
jgi:DNA-binding NtrC family response regulator